LSYIHHFILSANWQAGKQPFTWLLKKSGQEQISGCYIPATVGELVTAGKSKVKVLCHSESGLTSIAGSRQ
jgi:hypothetical protein